jgi:hypothetical protein
VTAVAGTIGFDDEIVSATPLLSGNRPGRDPES